MLVAEATWLAFAVFSGLRTISYVPQIVRIAKDPNGASAISYPTWLLWTGAHASASLYAAMNLNEVWLAIGSSIYALCCLAVICLTVFKRLAHRRTKRVSSRDADENSAWGGRLRSARRDESSRRTQSVGEGRAKMDSIERRTFVKVVAAGVLATMLTAAPIGNPFAAAQEKYPLRPVKIVVPLPAGTSPDIRTRMIAEQLTKTWGQQVVVENRPGGGGLAGVQAVLSAPADGYTLLAAPATVFTILPVRANRPDLDVNRDLVPIGLIDHEGMLVAVSPKLGVNTLPDLIALAKREPYKIVIGTLAAGTLPHLAAQLLVERSKAPMIVLPYATGGSPAAIADLIGGRVHVVVVSSDSSKGVLDSGDLKAIAVMTRERSANLPDLPTVAETFPGLTAVGWTALVAPKGTPEGIVQQLEDDLRKALDAPNIRKTLDQVGRSFRPMFSAELARFIQVEQELWWPIAKAAAGSK